MVGQTGRYSKLVGFEPNYSVVQGLGTSGVLAVLRGRTGPYSKLAVYELDH